MPPLAITLHGLPFGPGHPAFAARLSLWAERLFLRLMPAHHLHFLSEEAAKSYTAAMGGPKAMARHQVHVLPNCSRLDPGPLAPRPKAPTLVMTGRVGRQKNLMAAAHLLRHLPPEVHLHLCGAGTDTPEFQRQFLETAGLSPEKAATRLRFLGPLRDIRPVLSGADVFLLPSRYEGMPIAAIEAFEAGMPLVVSRIPGLAEILAAHPMALAYDPELPETAVPEIMALLTRYRAEPEAYDKTIRAAWRESFSYEVWARGARGLLTALLDDGPQPRS